MRTKQFGQNAEVLWKDRKRYFGLPISFTRYYLVKNGERWTKIFRDVGLLFTYIDEVNLYRIRDISLERTLGDKIFGTGTIVLHSNDASMPVLRLSHIKNCYKVREMLAQAIEEQRKIHNVRLAEFQG